MDGGSSGEDEDGESRTTRPAVHTGAPAEEEAFTYQALRDALAAATRPPVDERRRALEDVRTRAEAAAVAASEPAKFFYLSGAASVTTARSWSFGSVEAIPLLQHAVTALARVPEVVERELSPVHSLSMRVEAHTQLAECLRVAGRLTEAEAVFRAGLGVARAELRRATPGTRAAAAVAVARAAGSLGSLLHITGRVEEGRQLHVEDVELTRGSGDDAGLATGLLNLACASHACAVAVLHDDSRKAALSEAAAAAFQEANALAEALLARVAPSTSDDVESAKTVLIGVAGGLATIAEAAGDSVGAEAAYLRQIALVERLYGSLGCTDVASQNRRVVGSFGPSAGASGASLLALPAHLCLERLLTNRARAMRAASGATCGAASPEEAAAAVSELLRQAAVHRVAVFGIAGRPVPTTCDVCMEALDVASPTHADVVVLRCLHAFHHTCAARWFEGQRKFRCPVCRGWSSDLDAGEFDPR